MRALAIAVVLLPACAHSRRPLTVATPTDTPLNRDRALVCMYQAEPNRLTCVSPEEYALRHAGEGP